jgi:hypothetical protein
LNNLCGIFSWLNPSLSTGQAFIAVFAIFLRSAAFSAEQKIQARRAFT